jgi:tRNA threonylcarbamoyladenosine biosynthesis protein TsaB
MNLLAIETSTENCSVALLHGDSLVGRSELAPRRHAERVLPMCDEVLAEAGLHRSALDAIAVGRGPGAFTGVRLAIAVAQGIALAFDLPVVPVSSLAALALQAGDDADAILAVIDARMGEVYAGAFRPGSDGLVVAMGPETVGAATDVVLPKAATWHVIGTGWARYADALGARLPAPPRLAIGEAFPQAIDIARLAAPLAARGEGVRAEEALPVYLRDKVALTLAEQRGRARADRP